MYQVYLVDNIDIVIVWNNVSNQSKCKTYCSFYDDDDDDAAAAADDDDDDKDVLS